MQQQEGEEGGTTTTTPATTTSVEVDSAGRATVEDPEIVVSPPPGNNKEDDDDEEKQQDPKKDPYNDDGSDIIVSPINNKNNKLRKFPKPFYCVHSKELMKDPVVHPSGNSYERSIALKEDSTITYYPNRALKSIIEHEKQRRMEEGKMISKFRKMDENLRSTAQNILERSTSFMSLSNSPPPPSNTTSSSSTSSSAVQQQGVKRKSSGVSTRSSIRKAPMTIYRPLPDGYYCPITQEIMYDPIIDSDGNTFERMALLNWVESNGKSPITRKQYDIEDTGGTPWFYPNTAIKRLIQLELSKSNESIHKSIRRWKQEMETNPPPEQEYQIGGGGSTTAAAAAAGTTSGGVATTPTSTTHPVNENEEHNYCGACICIIFILFVVIPITAPGLGFFYFLFVLFFLCAIFGNKHDDSHENPAR